MLPINARTHSFYTPTSLGSLISTNYACPGTYGISISCAPQEEDGFLPQVPITDSGVSGQRGIWPGTPSATRTI